MSVGTQYAPGTPFPSEFLEMENYFENCFVEAIKQSPKTEHCSTNSSSCSASRLNSPRQDINTLKTAQQPKSITAPGSPLFTIPKPVDDEPMNNLWGSFSLYDGKTYDEKGYYGSNQGQQNPYTSAPSNNMSPVATLPPIQTTISGQHSPPYTGLDSSFDPKTLSNPPHFDPFTGPNYSTDSRTVHGQITPPNEDSDPVFTEDIFTKKVSAETQTTSNRKRSSTAKTSHTTSSTTVRKSRKSNANSKEQEELLEAKRKRFLERNRVAASKCRQKKKAWMQQLEETARGAQTHSRVLHHTVGVLKNELLMLKGELLRHHDCDCDKIKAYLMREADRVVEGTVGGILSDVKPRQFSITESEMSSASDMFGEGDFDMILGDDDLDDIEEVKM